VRFEIPSQLHAGSALRYRLLPDTSVSAAQFGCIRTVLQPLQDSCSWACKLDKTMSRLKVIFKIFISSYLCSIKHNEKKIPKHATAGMIKTSLSINI